MKRYALVVGIGDYDHLPKLSKPKTDAEAIRDVLQTNQNFEVTLLNEGVTRNRLRDALKTLLKRGKNSDVLIYFTGHGFTAGEDEDESQGYLATQDCRIDVDEAGKQVLSAHRGFSFQSLNGLIAKAELSSLVMLLDCCHSGSFIETAQAREKLSALNKTRYFLITACRSFEQAYALRAAEHSIFSTAVLKALRIEGERITAWNVLQRVERDLYGTGQESLYLGAGGDVPILERQQQTAAYGVSEDCPYQGLKAFTPSTVDFFKGRDDEVSELCEKLTRAKFVSVLGPSGSGKSSVVRAGLETRLLAQGWQVVTMKPGDEPMANLKAGLRALFERQVISASEQRQLADTLRDKGLLAMVGQLPREWRVLLLIDQFEEVFTLCGKAMQRQFIGELLTVGQVENRTVSPLAVVMTMRSDFVDEWLSTGQPTAVIRNDTVWLGPLMGENLKVAIVEPAQKQGYSFGDGLLELLLADVEQEENCLPLLEFALTELWEQRDRPKRILTAAAYRATGGLKGSLNKRAEAVYARLRDLDRPWAKRICLQLVRIGRGEKDTRQRQPKLLLLNMGGLDPQKRQTIADVIKDLVNGRLLVSDGEIATGVASAVAAREAETDGTEGAGYVDLAHEALLEGWERFAQWRQEDRDLRRLVQRLEDAYEEWQEKSEDERYLLSSGLLLALKEQMKEQSVQLSEILDEHRPELRVFFSVSDEHEQANVAALELALAKSRLQEDSRRIRERFQAAPAQTVSTTLAAVELLGRSQIQLNGVTYPAKDSLHRAFSNIRERLRLQGHSDQVLSVAFSPQGDQIVSGSSDYTLRLWDLQGNPIGKPFAGHKSLVRLVAFSPQGDRIVSGSEDNTLRLWDLQGNPIGEPFMGHSGSVLSVAFSPQGDRIVSGSEDSTLRLWDLQGNPIGEPFAGHSSTIWSVAFSSQGNRIVSGSEDNTLRLWDLQGNPIDEPFVGHSDSVRLVAFNPKGNRIVSGSEDNTLRLWDLQGNPIGEPFVGHTGRVRAAAFSPQGDRIVSGSADQTLRLWDLQGNPIGEPFAGHSNWVRSVAFSPQGDRIISGGADQTLRLWDLQGNLIGKPFSGHSDWILSVAFSPQGDRIVSGSFDTTLRLWDLQGNPIGAPFSGHSDWVRAVAFSPQGDQIVSGSDDSSLRLWDLQGNPIGKPFVGHSDWVRAVAFSPQGDRIVSGGEDNSLRLWNLQGNLISEPFVGHSDWIRAVAFSPEGNRIVSGSNDSTLRLWDLRGNLIGAPFAIHSGSVLSVAFSPQGDRIVSGSEDNTLHLWDLEGNPISEAFTGHSGSVLSVAFSPQGDRIVSGSEDNTLRLWDLEGNSIGEPFAGHSDWVWSVAFSPEGDRIVSGSGDNTLRLWRCGTWQAELQQCCNMLMHHSALTLPQTETARKAGEVCQQVWTRPQSAEFLVAQGSALARTGKVEEAIEKFNRAQQLDAKLVFDAVARATELAEWG